MVQMGEGGGGGGGGGGGLKNNQFYESYERGLVINDITMACDLSF